MALFRQQRAGGSKMPPRQRQGGQPGCQAHPVSQQDTTSRRKADPRRFTAGADTETLVLGCPVPVAAAQTITAPGAGAGQDRTGPRRVRCPDPPAGASLAAP